MCMGCACAWGARLLMRQLVPRPRQVRGCVCMWILAGPSQRVPLLTQAMWPQHCSHPTFSSSSGHPEAGPDLRLPFICHRSQEVLSVGYLSAPSTQAAIVYVKAVVSMGKGGRVQVGLKSRVREGKCRGKGFVFVPAHGAGQHPRSARHALGLEPRGVNPLPDRKMWAPSPHRTPLSPAPAGHPHAHGLEQGGHGRLPAHHESHGAGAAAPDWRVGALGLAFSMLQRGIPCLHPLHIGTGYASALTSI